VNIGTPEEEGISKNLGSKTQEFPLNSVPCKDSPTSKPKLSVKSIPSLNEVAQGPNESHEEHGEVFNDSSHQFCSRFTDELSKQQLNVNPRPDATVESKILCSNFFITTFPAIKEQLSSSENFSSSQSGIQQLPPVQINITINQSLNSLSNRISMTSSNHS
jgi:hypothetical protein